MNVAWQWVYVGLVGGMVMGGLITAVTQVIVMAFVSAVGPRIHLFFASPITQSAYASAPFVFGLTWIATFALCVRRGHRWITQTEHTPEAATLERTLLRWFILLSTLGAIVVLGMAFVILRGMQMMNSLGG